MPNIPDEVESDASKWKQFHPDFSYKLWTLDEILDLALQCKFGKFSGEEIANLIKICRFPAMKADLARLLILHTSGGVWVDLKLVPKRTFLSELLSHELVLVEHQKTEEYPDPAKFGLLNNWFFACVPHSEFVAEAASLALQNVTDRVPGVWNATGPRVFMRVRERKYPKAFENASPEIRIVRADEYMDVLVGYGWGSYNRDGMHWSERSKREPTYDE